VQGARRNFRSWSWGWNWSWGWIASAGACWLLTAALSRLNASASTINTLYGIALVWTYVAIVAVAIDHSAQRRVALFRSIALSGGIVFVLAGLEGAAVARIVDYRTLRDALRGVEGPDVNFIDDSVLLYRRLPNTRWVGRPRTDMASYFNLPFRVDRPITFTTDARGFRNPTTPTQADIALIGDSYVEGWGVSDEETASARLRALTGRPVANLGTAGYGSEQELRVLEHDALPLKPLLVAWFFFEGNDLDDDQNFDNAMLATPGPGAVVGAEPWSRRWRAIVDRSLIWNGFDQLRSFTDWLIPNRINTYGWFRDQRGTTHQMYFYDFYATRPLGEFERDRLQTTETTLARGAELCRANGIACTVYYVPMKFRVYGDLCTFPANSPCRTWHPWDLEEQVRAICARVGIDYVSLTEEMRRAATSGALLYSPTDSHWNANGQAFVANQVAARWRLLSARDVDRQE
jgi:hypothetical protein